MTEFLLSSILVLLGVLNPPLEIWILFTEFCNKITLVTIVPGLEPFVENPKLTLKYTGTLLPGNRSTLKYQFLCNGATLSSVNSIK